MFQIREIDETLRQDVVNIIIENWGSPIMVSRERIHHIDRLPGYVIMEDDKILGLITYNIEGDECELVSLDSFVENKGIGSILIDTVTGKCEELGCSRIWLITTNDNTRAIKFYQKRGFKICALYLNSVAKAREIKPEIPLFGYNNIPILHEIVFEKILIDEKIKKNLRSSYDDKVDYRESSEIQPWKLGETNKVLNYVKREDKVYLLDLGSGAGKQGKIFKDNGLDVTCIDISHEMVKLCREKNLNAYEMDFYNLVFPSGSFDVIWSMNTLLHVPKKSMGTVLQNIKRVLKPNGIFYFGIYGGYKFEGVWEEDFYNPKRFFAFYEDDEIKEIVKDYFDIVEFNIIPIERNRLHYQSFILRNTLCQNSISGK